MSRAKPLSSETANAVYDILRDECSASESGRENFVFAQTLGPCEEYRFQGNLGFGGKFYRNHNGWYVMCYPEDMTYERRMMIQRADERLKQLPRKYAAKKGKASE
jgi:hypothetical protein